MERIKELRISRGFTQKGLANALNVSRSTVAMWETGKSQPDNIALNKLADLLTTTCDYLLGRTDEIEEKESAAFKVAVTDDDIKFALFGDSSEEITDEDYEDVKRYAQFLKEKKKK